MEKNTIVCIGAALVDESYTCLETPLEGTSNPAKLNRSPGGVACNIAGHLGLLGHNVELISHFGNDDDGKWLADECRKSGIGHSGSIFNDSPTGKYVAILSPEGELFAGAASSQLEIFVTPDLLQKNISILRSASLIVFDCNLSVESMNWLLNFCREVNTDFVIEPVSIRKAMKLKNSNLDNTLLITPNKDEMAALAGEGIVDDEMKLIYKLLSGGIRKLWLRNGKNGSKIISQDSILELDAPEVNVVDITGAGDAALAGWIHGHVFKKSDEDCLRYGHSLSALVLQVKGAINKNLNKELLEETFQNYK